MPVDDGQGWPLFGESIRVAFPWLNCLRSPVSLLHCAPLIKFIQAMRNTMDTSFGWALSRMPYALFPNQSSSSFSFSIELQLCWLCANANPKRTTFTIDSNMSIQVHYRFKRIDYDSAWHAFAGKFETNIANAHASYCNSPFFVGFEANKGIELFSEILWIARVIWLCLDWDRAQWIPRPLPNSVTSISHINVIRKKQTEEHLTRSNSSKPPVSESTSLATESRRRTSIDWCNGNLK